MVDGFQPAQVQCDNYGWVGHPCEHCFNLYPKLRSSHGGSRGGTVQKGCGGRGGRGGGGGRSTPAVGAAPTATPPPTTKATMATRLSSWNRGLLPW